MKKILMMALAFVMGAWTCVAQEISCDVTVNMEQVGFENRNYVSSLERDVESYINNQRFTDEDWEGDPIKVEMQIVLAGGTRNVFAARVLINAVRTLDGPDEIPSVSPTMRIYDDTWQFEYNNGANLTYNPMRYDRFTSFIDYYMLMIIGLDADTYAASGGTAIFSKARNLAVQAGAAGAAGFETNKQPSEFNKYNFANEVTDMRLEEVRRLIFAYYVNGMDIIGFDRAKGIAEIKNILLDMADYKRNRMVNHSLLLQVFFEAKFQEIAAMFSGTDDEEFFTELMFLDPSNSLTYQQAREGKFIRN